MLLAIDPGKSSGFAIFDTALVWVGRAAPPPPWLEGVTHAVIEHPVVYPHGGTPNPNDIVRLAVTAGELAGILQAHDIPVRYVEPHQWKGSIDKHTCCRRAWARLSPDEQAVAERFRPESSGPIRGGKDHVLDAIGIGLFACGRFKR